MKEGSFQHVGVAFSTIKTPSLSSSLSSSETAIVTKAETAIVTKAENYT